MVLFNDILLLDRHTILEHLVGGSGEKARQKFSIKGLRAPGYLRDHFQTVKRMLASDLAQKMLCITVPNRRTASPEFLLCVRTRRLL